MTTHPVSRRTAKKTATKGQTGAARTAGTKTASSPLTVRWMETTQRHDYPAAASYLSLLAGPSKVRRLVSALRTAPVARFKAKDLLRAAGLPLLPADDIEVAKDLAQIHAGNPLSPCLMIRGNISKWHQAQIADGYHRVCASYYTDEDTEIPVKIVRL